MPDDSACHIEQLGLRIVSHQENELLLNRAAPSADQAACRLQRPTGLLQRRPDAQRQLVNRDLTAGRLQLLSLSD